MLPRKKGKIKKFFGALNPFKGSKKGKDVNENVPYVSPRDKARQAEGKGSANSKDGNESMMIVTEADLDQFEQERSIPMSKLSPFFWRLI